MGNREEFEIPVIEFTTVTIMIGTTSGTCKEDPDNPDGVGRTDFGQQVEG